MIKSLEKIGSNRILISQFQVRLHGLGKPLAIRLKMWKIVQACWPFFLCVSYVYIIDEVSVHAADPEICYCQVITNQPLTFFTKWLNNAQEFWQNLIENFVNQLFFFQFVIFKVWLINDRLNCIETFEQIINFVSEPCIIWVVAMDWSQVSGDGEAFTELSSIWQLETWHLPIWHLRLLKWPLVKWDLHILPINTGMIKQHSNWLTTNIKLEIIQFIYVLCHLLFLILFAFISNLLHFFSLFILIL